jgi:hypothetical protein
MVLLGLMVGREVGRGGMMGRGLGMGMGMGGEGKAGREGV